MEGIFVAFIKGSFKIVPVVKIVLRIAFGFTEYACADHIEYDFAKIIRLFYAPMLKYCPYQRAELFKRIVSDPVQKLLSSHMPLSLEPFGSKIQRSHHKRIRFGTISPVLIQHLK